MCYISVILPLKLEWVPCYAVPDGIGEGKMAWEERRSDEVNPANAEIQVGDRVRVKFANREYIGVVSAVDITPDIDPGRILPIVAVERGLERILPEEIELWKAISDYYLCDIGEVYKAAYPLRKINLEEAKAGALAKVQRRRERFADAVRVKIGKLEARMEKKKSLLEKAKKESVKEKYQSEIAEIEKEINAAGYALQNIEHPEKSGQNAAPLTSPHICFSEAQSKAVEEVRKGFQNHKPVMLHGVTGSGKTEIYIKLTQEAMRSGKNVLYLVPEIALSRQLEERLEEYFGERLLVYHSGVTEVERRNVAEAVRREIPNRVWNDGMGRIDGDGDQGETRDDRKKGSGIDEQRESGNDGQGRTEAGGYIVLGTRSSLFLPHHNLGLIIVDEEHDNSYKQDSPAPRYNGRDTALMLSKIQGADIILGSATPSLEEIFNCNAGRHTLVELKEKFHGTESSDIEIIDTKAERKKNGMVGNFSRKLIERISRTIERGEQVMILRSRRAWATVMQCESCGEISKCPHCNVSLSQHKNGRMICHYCGYAEPYTGKCRKCGGTLASLGAGTQRIEEEAEKLFPNARIARLDSDTAQNKGYETKIIKEFSKGNIDILIGTQIVTKGFDFSGLTLVAVIAADALLGVQDFRADEKALQLLEQFRGRCGRRDRKGLFVIQTSQPEHPVYQQLTSNQNTEVNTNLMLERKEFNFPPYSRIVEITVKDIYEDRAERMAWKLGEELRRRFDTGGGILGSPVTGPYSPAVDKIADHYIRTIRISLKKDRSLAAGKAAIKAIVQNFEKGRKYDGHITINVDPS